MDTYKISSVHALIQTESGEILLTKRKDVPIWVIPGGHVELGESPEEAVKREVKEELGLEIDKFIPIVEYKYPNTIKILFKALVKDNTVVNACTKEVRDYGWFKIGTTPNPMSVHDKNKIKDALRYKDKLIIKNTYVSKKVEIINLAKNPIHFVTIFLYLVKNKVTGGSFKF